MNFDPCPAFIINSNSSKRKRVDIIDPEVPEDPEDPSIDPLITHLDDMPIVGDLKTSLVNQDGGGWFTLDGRTITNDAIAEDSAITLFGSTTLPDYRGHYSVGSDVTGVIQGNSKHTLQQSNLPNVRLPLNCQGVPGALDIITTTGYGNVAYTATEGIETRVKIFNYGVDMNPVTQTDINLEPLSFTVQYKVYLGTSAVVA